MYIFNRTTSECRPCQSAYVTRTVNVTCRKRQVANGSVRNTTKKADIRAAAAGNIRESDGIAISIESSTEKPIRSSNNPGITPCKTGSNPVMGREIRAIIYPIPKGSQIVRVLNEVRTGYRSASGELGEGGVGRKEEAAQQQGNKDEVRL